MQRGHFVFYEKVITTEEIRREKKTEKKKNRYTTTSWSSHILSWLLSEAQFQSTEAKWAQSKCEILWQGEGSLQPQRALVTWKWCVGKEAASALGHIFTQRRKITSVLHHPAACHNHKGLFTHWSDSEPPPGLPWQSINSQVSHTQPGHWLNPLWFLQVVKEGLNFWLHYRKSISRLALSCDFTILVTHCPEKSSVNQEIVWHVYFCRHDSVLIPQSKTNHKNNTSQRHFRAVENVLQHSSAGLKMYLTTFRSGHMWFTTNKK